jgi:hypothetical protein
MLGRGTDLDALIRTDREDSRMSMFLSVRPNRRRSRRTRSLRARLSFAIVAMLLTAYIAWHPPFKPQLPTGASLAMQASARPAVEPEQSIDTEGALAEARQLEDAGRYIADR